MLSDCCIALFKYIEDDVMSYGNYHNREMHCGGKE